MTDSPVHALIAAALKAERQPCQLCDIGNPMMRCTCSEPDLRKLAESALWSIAPGVSPAVFLADRSVTDRHAGLLERLSD